MAGQVKFTPQEVSFFQTQAETARTQAQKLDGVKREAEILYAKWGQKAPDDAEFNRENLQIQKAISDLQQWRKALEDTHHPAMRRAILIRPDTVPESERETFKMLQDQELTTKMATRYFDERFPKAQKWIYSLETFRDSALRTVGKWTGLASATTFTPQPPKKELDRNTPEFQWDELAINSMQKAKELAWIRCDVKIVKRKWDQAAPNDLQFSQETQKAKKTLQELDAWRGTAQTTSNTLPKKFPENTPLESLISIADSRLTTAVSFSHFDSRITETRAAVQKLVTFRDGYLSSWFGSSAELLPSVSVSNAPSSLPVSSETAQAMEDEPGSPNSQPDPLELKTVDLSPPKGEQNPVNTPPVELENSQHDPGLLVQTIPPQSRFDCFCCWK